MVCVLISCSNLLRSMVSTLSSVDIPGKKRGSATAEGASVCFTSDSPSVSCTLSFKNTNQIKNHHQTLDTISSTAHELVSPVPLPSWAPTRPCPSSTSTCGSVNCSRHILSVKLKTPPMATSSPRPVRCRSRSVRRLLRPSCGIFVRAHGRRRWRHRWSIRRISEKRYTFWLISHTTLKTKNRRVRGWFGGDWRAVKLMRAYNRAHFTVEHHQTSAIPHQFSARALM